MVLLSNICIGLKNHISVVCSVWACIAVLVKILCVTIVVETFLHCEDVLDTP